MRRTFSVAALMAMVAGAVFFAAAPATAQTGYPPTCNPADLPEDLGTRAIGETFTVVLAPNCIWTPGASVVVTVNGTAVGPKVADANGTVSVSVQVVSATELLIDDPVSVVANCARNTVVGTGPSQAAGGINVTDSAFFKLNCPGTPGGGGGGDGGGGRVAAKQGRVAFTGANMAKWAAIALGLVAVGALLVTLNRRRRHSGS